MSGEEVAITKAGVLAHRVRQISLANQANESDAEELNWHSATELARLIARGEVSSSEVVAAHIQRVESVNAGLNALVVPLFEEARSDAAEADRRRARGDVLGALHGVPITIKECYHVAGTPSSIGVSRFRDQLLTIDSPLVTRLRRAGAILLGKTNVPQAMLLHETDNPVYGRTNNPWDLARSPGGSSGGEAALIAAGGSPLGLANDLGGSIRQPAHACGIYGIKPTTGRLTNAGCRNNLSGLKVIATQSGAMARSTEDLALAMRVLSQRDPAEPAYDDEYGPVLGDPAAIDVCKLRIGWFAEDGYFRPSPAVRRAVHVAAEALSALGCELIEFEPPQIDEAMSLYFSLIGADGGRALSTILDGTPIDWRIARLMKIGSLEQPWRSLAATFAATLRQPHIAQMLRSTGRKTDSQLVQLSRSLEEFTARFSAAMDAERIDALLFPPHALVAPRHGSTIDLPPAASYCFLANLFGLPAGTLPVTRVRTDEESDRGASLQLVERAARLVEAGSAGLPVGVQIAAKPWREDIVLAVMKALEDKLSGSHDLPRRPPI